ncbi:MAG TPA: serine/threonine-protein kinase [Gaiellaceae bacterium]|nr:serine/threonine-protein kinase [Gaiellaceae bacterium]
MSNAALALEGTGLVLGRYRPLKPLGSGGSGSVWLARDEQTGLEVALKIVAREGKAAARAEREAAAAAKLRHPSCLRAYAFARDPRHVYIAYEYVPGSTFREAMRAGELPDPRALAACAEICDALAHAHAAGVLHRDVKPSNVLLGDTRAKLLDFGLARMQEAETLTAQGDVPGTLAYIAPERLAGDEATGAADVWSVGVMLWEALAGRHPFWHTSMLETARAIEAGAPSLAELRPDLPKALIQLVDASLSLSPARRPSAADLAAGLRGAATPRRRRRARAGTIDAAGHAPRALAAGLAAAFAALAAAGLPFYPGSWTLPLAVLAALAAALRPRLGLALALAVPVLPLGNVSLGLAVLYGSLALAWLVLAWREPHAGLLFALGPLLAPVAALGLVPLAAGLLRAWPRRAAQAALAVPLAALAAGLRGNELPLVGGRPPLGLGVAGANDPLDVAGTLLRVAGAHPALLAESLAFAALAVAVPYARDRGRWGAAGLGAAMLVLTVLAVPSAHAAPLAAAAWLTAAALVGLRRRAGG